MRDNPIEAVWCMFSVPREIVCNRARKSTLSRAQRHAMRIVVNMFDCMQLSDIQCTCNTPGSSSSNTESVSKAWAQYHVRSNASMDMKSFRQAGVSCGSFQPEKPFTLHNGNIPTCAVKVQRLHQRKESTVYDRVERSEVRNQKSNLEKLGYSFSRIFLAILRIVGL